MRLASLLCACLFTVSAQAETVLRVANWLPATHPIVADMVTPWGQQVEEATQGRVKVEIMQASLGKPPAHYDIARDGLADVTYGVHGYTAGRFLLTQMAELPFLSTSSEALSVAYWQVYQELLAGANEHEGVHLLGLFTHGPGHYFSTQQPLMHLADAANQKVRVGGGIVNEVAKNLNMVPLQAPSTQTYELLANGVADGLLFPNESVPFFKLDKVLKYGTLVPEGLYNTSFFLVMNEGTWNKLSPEDQAAIDSVSGAAFAKLAGQAWDAADAKGLETMRAAGIQIDTATPELIAEMQAALKPVEESWILAADEHGVDGAAALKKLREMVAAYGK